MRKRKVLVEEISPGNVAAEHRKVDSNIVQNLQKSLCSRRSRQKVGGRSEALSESD